MVNELQIVHNYLSDVGEKSCRKFSVLFSKAIMTLCTEKFRVTGFHINKLYQNTKYSNEVYSLYRSLMYECVCERSVVIVLKVFENKL